MAPSPTPTPVEFHFDPVCPFAWMTSRWLVDVVRQRPMAVTWRFLSLQRLNAGRDYDQFPPGYLELHWSGLRMLRVCAAARDHGGHDAVASLYTALGELIWYRRPGDEATDANPLGPGMADVGSPAHLAAALRAAGLPAELAAAAHDESYDAVIDEETQQARARAGDDVGTPVIAVDPPHGPAFFGPVISSQPPADQAVELWDAVTRLAQWPGFAELKRSQREALDLPLVRG